MWMPLFGVANGPKVAWVLQQPTLKVAWGLGVAAANLDYFRTIFGPMLAMLLHPNEEATLLEHLPQSARAAFESFVAQDGNVGTRRAGK